LLTKIQQPLKNKFVENHSFKINNPAFGGFFNYPVYFIVIKFMSALRSNNKKISLQKHNRKNTFL